MTPHPELLVFLKLLAAHLLADFPLQTRSWIESKRGELFASPALWMHAGVVLVLTWTLLGDWSHVGLPLFVAATHLLIDRWKAARPNTAFYFVADQLAHLLVIAAGWSVYCGVALSWYGGLAAWLAQPAPWILGIGYLVAVWPFGYLVDLWTHRWRKELEHGEQQRLGGLQDAGMWIGRVERVLILTFILLNQYSAIGFLIAAKSVFRFTGKLEGDRDRKEAEYILIGTLLSFALAIGLGIAVRALMQV